jgi:hypothetical protein
MFVVYNFIKGGCRGSYRMVVGFTVQSVPITTKVVVFNATFNNISVISSGLLLAETTNLP